ncbi:alcohol dehydrogenase catalytic domain-containing protein [Micromonospora purpureochromogenes]|uniref:alcohol dehydrogenase catalytic domain-containing protein n=1 Tax=Micromonospora purpureochromogenes TaxID=47872 RepID=UPI0033E9ED1D
MLAAVLREFGTPLRAEQIDQPVAGAGQVLVRVMASGVNPLDTKIQAGKAPHSRIELPAVLGLDLAGVVAALGPEVTGFELGDEVYGLTGGVGDLQGSLAEYAAVDARLLARKPRTLSMRAAAALPLAVITSWEGLVDRAGVRAGQKVLVHGGAGGVGHVGVQLALARGAEVYATGSHSRSRRRRERGRPPTSTTPSDAQLLSRRRGGAGPGGPTARSSRSTPTGSAPPPAG